MQKFNRPVDDNPLYGENQEVLDKIYNDKTKNYVVYGNAGCGKTLIVEHLADRICQEESHRNVLIMTYNRFLATTIQIHLDDKRDDNKYFNRYYFCDNPAYTSKKNNLHVQDFHSFIGKTFKGVDFGTFDDSIDKQNSKDSRIDDIIDTYKRNVKGNINIKYLPDPIIKDELAFMIKIGCIPKEVREDGTFRFDHRSGSRQDLYDKYVAISQVVRKRPRKSENNNSVSDTPVLDEDTFSSLLDIYETRRREIMQNPDFDIATALVSNGSVPFNQFGCYDYILIDEGQDFSYSMLDIAFRMLKKNGRVFIFTDSSQQIYSTTNCFTYLQKNMEEKYGMNPISSRYVKKVYRYGGHISEFLTDVKKKFPIRARNSNTVESDKRVEDDPNKEIVDELPIVVAFDGSKNEEELLLDDLTANIEVNGVSLVVFPRRNELYTFKTKLEDKFREEFPDSDESDDKSILAKRLKQIHVIEAESGFNVSTIGIYLCTYHMAKGLEFNKVYVPDCTNKSIPPRHYDDCKSNWLYDLVEIQNENIREIYQDYIERFCKEYRNVWAKLLYVALSRAKENIMVSYHTDRSKDITYSDFMPDFLHCRHMNEKDYRDEFMPVLDDEWDDEDTIPF